MSIPVRFGPKSPQGTKEAAIGAFDVAHMMLVLLLVLLNVFSLKGEAVRVTAVPLRLDYTHTRWHLTCPGLRSKPQNRSLYCREVLEKATCIRVANQQTNAKLKGLAR